MAASAADPPAAANAGGATKDASIMLDLIPPGNILLSTTAGIRIMAHHDDTDTTYAERAERRAKLAPGAQAGVTEAIVHDVVHAFYGHIRADAELGPMFARVLGDGGR